MDQLEDVQVKDLSQLKTNSTPQCDNCQVALKENELQFNKAFQELKELKNEENVAQTQYCLRCHYEMY